MVIVPRTQPGAVSPGAVSPGAGSPGAGSPGANPWSVLIMTRRNSLQLSRALPVAERLSTAQYSPVQPRRVQKGTCSCPTRHNSCYSLRVLVNTQQTIGAV